MRDVWKYIVEDFLSFIGALSIFGGIALGLTYLLKKYVDYQLQRNIQGHKREMDKQIESFKHIQQKAYKEFDLYTTKMYEVYPELYKRIEYAYGEILNLRGVVMAPDLRKFNQAEFDEHLDELQNLSKTEITSLSSSFSIDKDRTIKELHKKMEWVRYHKANLHYAEAQNFFIVSELYLTDEASSATRELLNLLRNYYNDLNPDYNGHMEIVKDRQSARAKLPGVKDLFRDTLKKDLKKSFDE